MSPHPAKPARTHAVLIGIESYAAGSTWDLNGPARDVLEMHGWLRDRGVPAPQITVLVSPLAANADLFGEAGLATLPATSGSIRRALNAVREREGDLLVLFWAGHGAIHQREHRLFAADATTADKRNWEWDKLRRSLESTYFAGFPRQIVLVDACADYRNDFEFSAPGETLPVGNEMPHQHFVFFATQPGQTAKNLGAERAGLFSQELLRQLKSTETQLESTETQLESTEKGVWPPDMVTVAEGVERAFDKLIAEGKATQMPRFEWNDWNGNGRDSPAVAPPAGQPPAGKPVRSPQAVPLAGSAAARLTPAQLAELTNALMLCRAVRSESRRNDLLSDLRADIADRIERRSDTRSDLMSILRTASNYPDGLSQFLQLVHAAEGPSEAWAGVETCVTGSLANLRISLDD